jgi:hypothetical protein
VGAATTTLVLVITVALLTGTVLDNGAVTANPVGMAFVISTIILEALGTVIPDIPRV